MRVWHEDNRLVIGDGRYTLWLEPWGNNSFRVRMTGEAVMVMTGLLQKRCLSVCLR